MLCPTFAYLSLNFLQPTRNKNYMYTSDSFVLIIIWVSIPIKIYNSVTAESNCDYVTKSFLS